MRALRALGADEITRCEIAAADVLGERDGDRIVPAACGRGDDVERRVFGHGEFSYVRQLLNP